MIWETISKGFLLCLIPVGFVVDCKLYLDVGSLVRISVRSGVVSCLPGYWCISKKMCLKPHWEELALWSGEREETVWAQDLKLPGCIADICIERRDVLRMICHSSEPWPQNEASLPHVLLFSVSEMCDGARSCPCPFSGTSVQTEMCFFSNQFQRWVEMWAERF